jgi:hypothetical protein
MKVRTHHAKSYRRGRVGLDLKSQMLLGDEIRQWKNTAALYAKEVKRLRQLCADRPSFVLPIRANEMSDWIRKIDAAGRGEAEKGGE